MSKVTESEFLGNLIILEGPSDYSREAVTIASGNSIVAGEVLGKITASGKYAPYDPDGVDGTETATVVAREDVDASAADATGVVIDALAILDSDYLTWEDDISAGDKADGIADLRAQGIKVR